ncbi:STAS-like domain-containing protein [Thermophagus xiamenensis]|jgi:hypothetical protein|uniref:DUF4325 domain-containing protein n=1 Tax=Thermophagus xiamenensis TaxID=385682 RepID=A0A1I1VSR2_9BACT|nr:STAS-like domain-containing protein [Thermophagus xiamenensis]SFD85961.1 protein of unknown function [Thermophagus xiamenensis]
MENTTINIVNIIGDVFGIEAEDGQKVFEMIVKAFKEKKKVILSFQNIEMLTTAFLNTAVGQLYKDFVDKATVSICSENNLVLLTNDRDFKNSGLDILTGNPRILN